MSEELDIYLNRFSNLLTSIKKTAKTCVLRNMNFQTNQQSINPRNYPTLGILLYQRRGY